MKGPRIVRAAALSGLDSAQAVEGYLVGFNGGTLPDGASFSFLHGWRNGMSDSGRREIDKQQRELAHDFVATGAG